MGGPLAGRRARTDPGGVGDGRRLRTRRRTPDTQRERRLHGTRRRHRASPRIPLRPYAVRADAPGRGRERRGEGRGRRDTAARRMRGWIRNHRRDAFSRDGTRGRVGGGERAGRRRRDAAAHGREGRIPRDRAHAPSCGGEGGHQVSRGAPSMELRGRWIRAPRAAAQVRMNNE